jgi:hypothetical protein
MATPIFMRIQEANPIARCKLCDQRLKQNDFTIYYLQDVWANMHAKYRYAHVGCWLVLINNTGNLHPEILMEELSKYKKVSDGLRKKRRE